MQGSVFSYSARLGGTRPCLLGMHQQGALCSGAAAGHDIFNDLASCMRRMKKELHSLAACIVICSWDRPSHKRKGKGISLKSLLLPDHEHPHALTHLTMSVDSLTSSRSL